MAAWLRYPTIHRDRIVFVVEDDLWSVSSAGGSARRLTTGLGTAARPRFSPDGATLAFDGAEEGVREVYHVDADGGPVRRLTWHGDTATVLGWTPGGEVLYTTAAGQPFPRDTHPYAIDPTSGPPRRLPVGPVAGLHLDGDRAVLCRHSTDLAWWKRYRGGRMGTLWVRDGAEPFRKLGLGQINVAAPCWLAGRLYFVADPAGVPQLVSCRVEGGEALDLTVHSDHADLAVRFPSTDGRSLVYCHGGDLYHLVPGGRPARIEVDVRSQRTERQRRFPSPTTHLEDWDLHPDGHSLALTVRGRAVTLGNWEGAAEVLPTPDGVRHRLTRWVDAERLLVLSDAGGEEALELHGPGTVRRYDGLGHGRVVEVWVDPTGARVAFTDHGHRLYLLSLDDGAAIELDHSTSGPIAGADWSADGNYLAWARPEGPRGQRSRLRLRELASGRVVDVTTGEYFDASPSFDPDGRHLYFVSSREFDPVYETQYFGYAFPRGIGPYLVTLHADARDPFLPDPRPLKGAKADRDKRPIDLDGLAERIVRFPVAEGRYDKIVGLGSGQVLLVRPPLRGTLDRSWYDPGPPKADASLMLWEFDKQELVELTSRISAIRWDRQREHLGIRAGARLRVVAANLDKAQREELKKTDGRADRKSGWIDLQRVRVSVDPGAEWTQMLVEAWRLMRDNYWEPTYGGVDWHAILERYRPLVDRVATRGELSDLVWCMQGELGTSHAYEMGGDYSASPTFRIGRLGADLGWDPDSGAWRITRLVRGEPGDRERSSPLCAPGLGVAVGEVVHEIAGTRLSASVSPDQALANQAGTVVALSLGEPTRRRVVSRTLSDDRPLRYRQWVLENRARVTERTGGRVGYVHVPDMGPGGFAEFHRDFIRESERDALLVDVRFNRGGHVSQLLLARLAQRRLGYRISRWTEPSPYPASSIAGPMLALTNEMAGSDGDIFSHAWKRLGLGPLIGTRTWGGVVGIWPRQMLVDRGITTQPEHATWFDDVGFGLENHGTDPDVVVEVTPDDWANGADPQLDRAIAMLIDALAERPPMPVPPRLPPS